MPRSNIDCSNHRQRDSFLERCRQRCLILYSKVFINCNKIIIITRTTKLGGVDNLQHSNSSSFSTPTIIEGDCFAGPLRKSFNNLKVDLMVAPEQKWWSTGFDGNATDSLPSDHDIITLDAKRYRGSFEECTPGMRVDVQMSRTITSAGKYQLLLFNVAVFWLLTCVLQKRTK